MLHIEGNKEMGREGDEAIKILGHFSAFMFSTSPLHIFSHSIMKISKTLKNE